MARISKIAGSIQTSFTRQLFNMAKQYEDVVDLTLGDPDLQPHTDIKNAACIAIQDGKTRYSQNAGLLELRDVISKYYLDNEGLSYNSTNEIIATVGAMEGLYLSLLSLIDDGDEVIIPAPYYVNYAQMVRMCGGKPIIVDNDLSNDLSINVKAIESVINQKSKVIIINTPCNPSGRIISTETIKGIAELAKKYDLIVIADEVYKSLIYDNISWFSIAKIEGMKERCLLVNSLSKEFCMTGYRIGYVVGPSEVIEAMTKLQENVAACAPLPSQYAAIEALKGGYNYSKNMVSIFTKRRDYIINEIKRINGLSCIVPDATFYLMVDISQTGMSSLDFAISLLETVHVAVVPGLTYGQCCDKYVRIAFTKDISVLAEAIRRISLYMNKLVR